MTERVVVDVGGSGVKLSTVSAGSLGALVREECSEYEDLLTSIRSLSPRPKAVAVATAGFVNRVGSVRSCRVAPYLNGDLQEKLTNDLGCPVDVMNDGEAHALAMRHTPGASFGAVAVALGTSIGLGVLGYDKQIVLPCSGENWDLGEWRLKTRASHAEIWWALGSHGLGELETNLGKDDGRRQFGHRLGTFLTQLTNVFQPRTIVVSGGMSRHWELFEGGVSEALAHTPSHLRRPDVLRSPYRETALVGAAQAVSAI